jgi:prefoldin subunit 5
LEKNFLNHAVGGGPGKEERLLSVDEIDYVPGSIGTDTKHTVALKSGIGEPSICPLQYQREE